MKALSCLVMIGACGSEPAPVKNSAPPPPAPSAREEKPDCLSAIEHWYFVAGIQPSSPNSASDAQFEVALEAMRSNEQSLVELCRHDQWTREVRRCFTTIGSPAMGVEPHEPADCKRMLEKTQLANLEARIRQLGETALD